MDVAVMLSQRDVANLEPKPTVPTAKASEIKQSNLAPEDANAREIGLHSAGSSATA